MKKRYKFWIGILISGIFFFLFIRGMDIGKVWKATREANYFYVLLSLIVNTLIFLIRAERWKYLMDPIKRIRFSSLFSAECIGFMGNSLLPARAGEFIRAYIIGKREHVSKTSSFATIVIERLFDGLVLLFMLIVVVAIYPFPEDTHGSYITVPFLKLAVVLTAFFYGLVISVLILLCWKPRNVWLVMNATLFKYLPQGFVSRIEIFYNSFVLGLESLKRGRHMVSISIYSIFLWLVAALGFYLLFPAFSMPLSYFSSILVMVAVAIVVMLPSSPGYVGTFHLASSEALILLGVTVDKAKSFALVSHAVCIIPVVFMGLFYLSREQMSLAEIGSSAVEDINK
ncbi:flippase-like domain-containing protein [bacterium]|nr:flippase-like domain-containing protein [bacterium]